MRVKFNDSYRRFDYNEPDYYETIVEEWKDWIQDGNCVVLGLDTSIFFEGDIENTQQARRCCFACPTQKQCAEYAIVTRENYGIWGGLDFKQRRAIRRRWKNGTRTYLRTLIEAYGPTIAPIKIYRRKKETQKNK